MRNLFFVIMFAVIPVLGHAQDTPQGTGSQGQIPVFRKNVSLVNVLFTVKDKHNALIPGLSKDQFDLFEDGKPQTIKYFSAESDQPLTLGLMIDTSYSMNRMLPEEKVVAGGFLQKVVTPKDLAFVVSFDISVDLLQDLTSDMHLLRKGLDKARINTNTAGMTPTGNPGPVPTARQNQGTLLFDGVYLGADEVLSKQTGRKAMVVLTDGEDQGSKLKLRDAIEAAQKADVVTYVLLISDPQFQSNYGDMSKLTEQTGGRIIVVNHPDKLDKAFAEIAAELRSQYSIGYTSTDTKNDGRFRHLEIKSKDGYKIQSRKGYYAPTDTTASQ